ncbi:MAG: hypothetical protein ABUS79_03525 [Pseudomonadota bacterium]
MTFWVANWLRAFGLTVLIEVVVAVPLLSSAEPSLGRRVGAVLAANLATHPLVWFLFPGLAIGRWAQLGLSEAWAFVAEVSLAANGASCLFGLLVMK